MKRSEINHILRKATELFGTHRFKLPPFAFWSTTALARGRGPRQAKSELNGLGWDVTDYGLNRFSEVGLLLFTIRNGNYALQQTYPKGYAEKIMMVGESQVTPYHFHWNKREDIINRGGGNLVIELYPR